MESSVTSRGWTSGMRAEPVSMSQVWLLTTASPLSPVDPLSVPPLLMADPAVQDRAT